ncbi:MAG: S49 family peptidase [Reyranella sp.]|uniref:S49 family peptidase n=1 Tax=Reyranella sp. TaxID=1929291 RepID=UPI0025D0162E|nr:S49 family peptidase [Reyranella sp.]MBR2813467.1 S49 family peptidase [Reyranella sp.]
MRYAYVASRAFGRPLLLEPQRGVAWLNAFAHLIGSRQPSSAIAMQAMEDDDGPSRPVYASLPVGLVERDYNKAYAQVGNVAVLKMDGVLVNSLGTVDPWCGMTGYDGLRTQLIAAMNDSNVKAIAVIGDTPGGEVTGCFDLADQFRSAREVKPIWAIVDGMACSAGYALACSTGRITCSSVGYTGSIGVIAAHWDYSKFLDEAGVKVSLVYAGAHKADGNSYQPLPDSVRADFQAEIDAIYDQFVPVVVAGRGLADKDVRATEARSYLAKAAVDLKLCDDVMSPTDALLELVELVS